MPRLNGLVRESSAKEGDGLLLVLLHGLGSDERDMFSAGVSIDERYRVVALRAPLRCELGGFAWFSLGWDAKGIRYDASEARSSLASLTQEVGELGREARIDPERTIIGGFSQGAIMSLALLLHRPGSIGGALLMSGALVPELVPNETEPRPDLPILVQHGRHDPVLPVDLGRRLSDLLVTRGFKPDHREYEMAHEVSVESLGDAQAWLKDRAESVV